jgi:hypothetical protein
VTFQAGGAAEGEIGALSTAIQGLCVSVAQTAQTCEKVMEAVLALPKVLKECESKRASKCGSRDYHTLCIQPERSLQIPGLGRKTYCGFYKKVLKNQETIKVVVNKAEMVCTLADAWQVLPFDDEVKQMHPVTAKFLELVIQKHSSRFSFKIDTEVGFSTTIYHEEDVFKYHGSCDKAAYFEGIDAPSTKKPETGDLEIYICPVPIFGAIEEKILYQKKTLKADLAQLVAQMQGFVEALQKVHNIYPARFPGLLLFAKNKDKPTLNFFCAFCVLWSQNGGHVTRKVSKLLVTEEEVCAGFEWWLRECKALRDLVAPHMVQKPSQTTHGDPRSPHQQYPEEDSRDGSRTERSGHVSDVGDSPAATQRSTGRALTSRTLQQCLSSNARKYNFVPAIHISEWVASSKAFQEAQRWNRAGKVGSNDHGVVDENLRPNLA